MSVSFLQWNILYTENPLNVIKLIKELKPDIFALQELTSGFDIHNGQNIPNLIAKELGYSYYVKLSAGSLNKGDEEFGNGIFSRFPIIGNEFHWINEYDPKIERGYDNEYKAYVEITVDINGQKLTVGTAHMSYTHRFINYPRKRKEADNLLTIIKSKKNRYVFSGDLNSRPNSYTVKNISRILKHAGPKFDAMTWTTKPFSYRSFEETELSWRLDYVFATPDLNIITSEIINTDYSDHLPILVMLDI